LRTPLLVLISCLGVFLSILSPVERAVSRFSVNVVENQLNVSLPLTDRTPDVLRIGFKSGKSFPSERVMLFSTVAQDVAWQTRSAGALIVALDGDGVWLGAKDEWIWLGKLSLSRDYQIDVLGNQGAWLSEVGSQGSLTELARLNWDQLPSYEVTGLHIRDNKNVSWKTIEVVTSPSEIPRPSRGMLFGYALVVFSALVALFGEWRTSRASPTMRIHSRDWRTQLRLGDTWWLWTAAIVTVIVVPPSHSESWIVEDLRIMEWVYGVNLGQFVARPFGGLFYFLLSFWAKVITPVWLLRLPFAVLFVFSASAFVRSFLVDWAGRPLNPRSRVIALMAVSISVFGQGEWLRPEIPIISMWMLSLSIAAGITEHSSFNGTRLMGIGLLLGLIAHHPLGVVVAIGAASFTGYQIIRLSRLTQSPKSRVCLGSVSVALSVVIVASLFGHNLGSFRRSLVEFRSGSVAHEVNFQLFERLRDLNNSPLLLSLSVSLCLAAILALATKVFATRVRSSRVFLVRLAPAVVIAAALLVPSGPWALYFVYLGPLTGALLAAVTSEARVSLWKSLLATACVVGALFLRTVNQPLAESTVLAIGLSAFLALVGLTISRQMLPALTAVFVIGAVLIAAAPILESVSHATARNLSEDCNRSPSPGLLLDLHQACLYTWATTDGAQWGDWVNEAITVSRASEGAYKPVSFSPQRLAGSGSDCGFISQLLSESAISSVIGTDTAHIAHAYVLLSPCTRTPDAVPNLEPMSGLIHGRSHDMNYFWRVLASILQNKYSTAESRCLTRTGVVRGAISIESVVSVDEPNCVVSLDPYPQIVPTSVWWKSDW
jgi:hypothetical protein